MQWSNIIFHIDYENNLFVRIGNDTPEHDFNSYNEEETNKEELKCNFYPEGVYNEEEAVVLSYNSMNT